MAILLLKRGKNRILALHIRDKEGRHMLVVYALGRIFNAHKSDYSLYQIKAEIIYFVSRGYKNMSFCEKFTN